MDSPLSLPPESTGASPQAIGQDLISLEQPTQQPDLVDLNAPGQAQIPSEDVATRRAIKAHVAFGEKSPGPEQLRTEILSGNEEGLRERMSVAKDLALRQIKLDTIQNVAAERAKAGKPMTEEDAKFIAGLSQEQLRQDPKIILETEYAREYFNKLSNIRDGKNPVTEGLRKDPAATADEIDVASGIKSRMEIAKTTMEHLEREYQDSSWGSAIANQVSRFIPLLENIRLHDSKGDSILPGANLQDRVRQYWMLPPQQFQEQLQQDVKELKEKNPLTAMKLVSAVLSYSASDEFLDNAFGVIDAATLPGLGTAGKLLAKGVKGASKLSVRAAENIVDSANSTTAVKQMMKDGIKADATPGFKPMENILEQSGDVKTASEITAYKDAVSKFAGQDPLNQRSRLVKAIPSLFNINEVMEGTKNLGREAADRLNNALLGNASKLLETVTGTGRVITAEGDALQTAIKETSQKLREAYPHLNDAVLDVSHIPAEKTAPNVNEVSMNLGRKQSILTGDRVETALGNTEATLFENGREADFWAREVYKLDGYKVKQQGSGYYIAVHAPVDLTSPGVRDVLISTRHETPVSWANTFLGVLRTPEDTLSVANRENRHIATHGSQEMHRLVKGVAENIGQLGNKELRRLERFIQERRDFQYFENGVPRRGVFEMNPGEFDTAWANSYKRPPSEKERIAYYTYVQLNDWDWMYRNLGIYRDKARQGIEHHVFTHRIVDEASGEAAMVQSPKIEGRVVKEIPWQDTEDAGIWVYDSTSHSKTYLRKNAALGEQRTDIQKKLSEGYKVVQVANPLDHPLQKISGVNESVNFIVVKDTQRSPLDWKQIDYRPGGHVEYKFNNWVKQPKIGRTDDGRHLYEGDTAIFNFATEAEARIYAQRMDHARQLLKGGKLNELESFLSSNLPYNLQKFEGLFKEVTLKDGTKVEAKLHLDDPIRHTTSGRNLLDAHKDIEAGYTNFENQIRSSYNLWGQIDKKYASTRNETLMTVRERAGKDEPLFRLEPSQLVDPMTTMNRAMGNVMRSRFLNDYKISSVESFIQEFGDLLNVQGGLNEIRKNPVYYLHNAVWDTQTPDKGRLAAAKNAQRAILSLIGTDSEVSQNLRWVQEGLMSSIYGKAGQKTSDYVAEHLLPITEDPSRYVRAVAFHSKLGLFNPVQLFLQAQTLTHVMAVAGPDAGLRGLSAASLMWRLEPTKSAKVVERFADMATKLGWKKEDFLESYAAMKKSGIFNVEGEVAIRDDIFEPKMFQGVFGKIADKGTFFFKEGERLVRLAAWNAAYREWKVANPSAVLDNAAMASILTRQNTFSVNMTRASSAAWQQGLMSVPTQFFSYQARLMEQFLGKRLTKEEKLRAFSVYAGVYGVPTAVGATTFAWPWYEDVRQAALERGYDVNAPGMRMLMEGIPSTVIQMATGNEQNYAQRLGPGGIQFFKEVFQKGNSAQLFGASPKIIGGMFQAVAPALKAVASPFVPGMGDWKFTTADTITALEEISTINNIGKMIYALNTHKAISKNEINLGEVSNADAVMMGMLGTQPLKIADAFIMAEMAGEQKKMQDAVKKEVIKNYRRALREFDQGNDQAAERLMNNVNLQIKGGGFRIDELPAIISEALSGYESLVDKMNEKYLKSAPQDQIWDRTYRVMKVRPNQQ